MMCNIVCKVQGRHRPIGSYVVLPIRTQFNMTDILLDCRWVRHGYRYRDQGI